MPNVKSARKRVKTNEKRRLRNRTAKAALKTSVKQLKGLIEAKDVEALKKSAARTMSVIGKTRRKGVINRRRAARLQSRLQRRINQVLAPPPAEAPKTE